ncbi:MAG: hypothetical protein AAF433_10910 [Bacteroidota bacterium]
MKYVTFCLAFLLAIACTDDDQASSSTDCQDNGPIRVRILQEIEPELEAFELNFWTDGVDSTTFFDLTNGQPSTYCSFARADACSFSWEARNAGNLVEDYAAICAVPAPLSPGDYTLRIYCEVGNCSRFEFQED